eukprot:g4878.t1
MTNSSDINKFSMQKEELLASSSREQLLASGACDSEAAAMSKIKVRPYVLQPMWVIGLAMVIAGSLGDFLALGFAPQSLCAPVGGFTIVANVIFANLWLGEKLSRSDLVATIIVTLGVVLSAVFADKSDQCFTLPDLMDLYTRVPFIIYIIAMILSAGGAFIFIRYADAVKRKSGRQSVEYSRLAKFHRIAMPLLSGMLGSQSIVFAKSFAELVKAAGKGYPAFAYFATYIIIGAMFTTIFGQIHWLARGLQAFDAVFVVPVFQCSFISFASLGGGIYFREFWGFSTLQVFMFPFGVATILLGVMILSRREVVQENERESGSSVSPHPSDDEGHALSPDESIMLAREKWMKAGTRGTIVMLSLLELKNHVAGRHQHSSASNRERNRRRSWQPQSNRALVRPKPRKLKPRSTWSPSNRPFGDEGHGISIASSGGAFPRAGRSLDSGLLAEAKKKANSAEQDDALSQTWDNGTSELQMQLASRQTGTLEEEEDPFAAST